MVYCAAGIKPPVVEAARRYEEEYGVHIELNYDSSGGLLSSIEVHPKGDLYIPADDLFTQRGRDKGLVVESMSLARFRLVVAVRPGNEKRIHSLDDLLRRDVNYVLCNEQAGAGNMTKKCLEKVGRWQEIRENAKVLQPTVNNAAALVKASNSLDAGLVWDSTAKQYGLDVVDLPEFAKAVADIHAGVLAACKQPAAALRFARYLAAPTKGGQSFLKHDYEPVEGDEWAEVPELKMFCAAGRRSRPRPGPSRRRYARGCRRSVGPGDVAGTRTRATWRPPVQPIA